MASQSDFDQGGTFRQTSRIYLGPSIGWIDFPNQGFLDITVGGTTTLVLGTTLVLVKVAAPVTIQLYTAKGSQAGAGANPGTFAARPITIIDAGGFANNDNITIVPFGTETIDSLTSIAITTQFGAYTLNPQNKPSGTGGWTLSQQ